MKAWAFAFVVSLLWQTEGVAGEGAFGFEFRQEVISRDDWIPLRNSCDSLISLHDDSELRSLTLPNGDSISLQWSGKFVIIKRASSAGNQIWSKTFATGGKTNLLPTRPVFLNDDRMVVSVGRFLHVLQLKSGKISWSRSTLGTFFHRPNFESTFSAPAFDGVNIMVVENPSPYSNRKPTIKRLNVDGEEKSPAWGELSDDSFADCRITHLISVPSSKFRDPMLFGVEECLTRGPSVVGLSSAGGPMWRTLLVPPTLRAASDFKVHSIAETEHSIRVLIESPLSLTVGRLVKSVPDKFIAVLSMGGLSFRERERRYPQGPTARTADIGLFSSTTD